ncbi:solute:Na+ symporter, SSS family [Actinopolymorpha cephalotaxi]|uniref:SSS family solute:Na+ symporter n=1 Tax=Actinopolymorpha cephalotaxi TaxID=504797 RepID=A0A1I2R2C2_9ACTN|nr:sodium:solute symporter family protein [Actinopolymorpha cephalotaxi]NYH82449.1 SSS family solute:Na+ symporter [Actinopolymorpha cephalotaxi]SFG32727.1 solute:Na+ symporter, SSS family [Actinopolymorpha cephalotaxi]
MGTLGWLVLGAYFVVMVGIGVWARRRIHDARDFFVAGGRMPWWLAGISHHMSGYSAAVFVGYAAVAYQDGFTLYVWWALTITVAMFVGSVTFAPRWPRLRRRFGIISPLEYLSTRYNVPAQQLLAWSGTALKVFDVGAKWAATAILLQVFAGVPLGWGILLTGGVTLVYSTIGGLWADALTDFGQFLIQLVAGVTMFVVVLAKLGGVPAIWQLWDRLPAGHGSAFHGDYTVGFVLAYLVISTLSYNGGTWNLAQRFIAAPTGGQARKAALTSAVLYLLWPLVLFFPMWAAPVLLPDLADPSQSYALLATSLLPQGLVGLVLAGMFAHTMAMTSSDANAISAVVLRDILPAVWRGARTLGSRAELAVGRFAVFAFIALSMAIALAADSFGGVLGLIVLWFGALVGPIAIPMLLGLLPAFRRCGPSAAITSWAVGLAVFALVKYVLADAIAALGGSLGTTFTVAGPVLCSFVVFVLVGLVRPWRDPESAALVAALSEEDPTPADETGGVTAHA